MNSMGTIVITGGHHNAALVVAKLLVKKGHQVIWIGHRRSSRGDSADSAEYIEVTAAKIPFHDLIAARLVPNVRELLRFPAGLARAVKHLRSTRPDAVLSFGGYLGGTVALSAQILGIPIYLHEQTVTAGRANKLTGRLARQIYLSWPQSTVHFPPGRTRVVGLPLRPSILSAPKHKFFSRAKPMLLVMGGKQGAHALNQFIFRHLPDLLSHFNLVHQTGSNSVTGDYAQALSLQSTLGSLSDCYLPAGYLAESVIGTYLRSADLYFGRSGAHICYELGIVGLPAILTPLSFTHDREQYQNAHILTTAGLGVILPQSELSLQSFLSASKTVLVQPTQPLSLPRNGAERLVTALLADLYGH